MLKKCLNLRIFRLNMTVITSHWQLVQVTELLRFDSFSLSNGFMFAFISIVEMILFTYHDLGRQNHDCKVSKRWILMDLL